MLRPKKGEGERLKAYPSVNTDDASLTKHHNSIKISTRVLLESRVSAALFLAFAPVLATVDYAAASEQAQLQQTVQENQDLTISAPEGYIIDDVLFASYGLPFDYTIDQNCHSPNSLGVIESVALGNNSFTITASNSIFGDPCPGVYKQLSVVVSYVFDTPPPYLNSPTEAPSLTLLPNGTLEVLWNSPEPSTAGTQIERYAIFFRAEHLPETGWAVSSTETNVYISPQVFEFTGGFNTTYYFMIRSDNDTLAIYSDFSPEGSIFVPVVSPTETPTESPEPTETPTPTPTPTDSPTGTPTPTDPGTQIPTPTEPTPTGTPTLTPQPTTQPTASPTPVDPRPTESPQPLPEPTPEPEPTLPPIDELLEIPVEELSTEQIKMLVEIALQTFETAEPGSPEYEQALDLLAVAAEADDPKLPEELAAVPVIGAVAEAALEVFNNLGNLGADMSPQARKDSEEVVVAAIIVGQVAQITVTTAAATAAISGGTSPQRK